MVLAKRIGSGIHVIDPLTGEVSLLVLSVVLHGTEVDI